MKTLLLLGLATLAVGVQGADAPSERIKASDFFDAHAGNIVYIELADSQVLVFDSNDNPLYVLHGRPLEIRAKYVEVNGDVTVRAFAPDEHAPDKLGQPPTPPGQPQAAQSKGSGSLGDGGATGTTGTPGDPGNPGSAARKMRLYVDSIGGKGTLTFDNKGMTGGRGQQGGIGGNGGHGGKGHDRGKCDGSDSPSTGGPGGDGGIGGRGGPGGSGGQSGDIEFGVGLCKSSSRVRFLSLQSEGGEGGLPGMGGGNGGGGLGGDGMGCVIGNGNGGSANPTNGVDRSQTPGPNGSTGPKGAAGSITCADCRSSPTLSVLGQPSCS